MRVVDAPDSFTEVIEESADLRLGSQGGKLLLYLFTERIYLGGIDTDLVKQQLLDWERFLQRIAE